MSMSRDYQGAIRHEATQVIGLLLFELIMMQAEHGAGQLMDELVEIFIACR